MDQGRGAGAGISQPSRRHDPARRAHEHQEFPLLPDDDDGDDGARARVSFAKCAAAYLSQQRPCSCSRDRVRILACEPRAVVRTPNRVFGLLDFFRFTPPTSSRGLSGPVVAVVVLVLVIVVHLLVVLQHRRCTRLTLGECADCQ